MTRQQQAVYLLAFGLMTAGVSLPLIYLEVNIIVQHVILLLCALALWDKLEAQRVIGQVQTIISE